MWVVLSFSEGKESYLSKNTYLTYMVNMTLALPDELHEIIRKHSDVKWSEVARKALWEHARKVEMMDLMDMQRPVMKELWDNPDDEAWDDA